MLGRPPSPQELSNYCKDTLGTRGQLIARKGAECKVPQHRFNDEVLVVLAAMYAIYRGQETVILTRDEDVFDQFIKLFWLIDTHYRSMYLAQRYAECPDDFAAAKATDQHREAFEGELLLVSKPSDILLPEHWTPAHVHCFLLRDKIVQVTFCAEQEIKELFRVKGATNGLSTDRFEERNCHVFLGDACADTIGNWAAIGLDRVNHVGDSNVRISVVDANLAVLSDEHTKQIRAAAPTVWPK